MSQNPLNLTVRFVLEIIALIAIGYGGWRAGEGFMRYILAIGLPLLAAFLWGAFRPVNEPHRAGHSTWTVPGWMRLLIEALVFGGGAWGFFSTGATTLGWIYLVVVCAHYVLSYDYVGRLLSNEGA